MYDSASIRESEIELFDGGPAVIGSLSRLFWVVVTLGLAALYFWLESANIRYRITSQRILIESGWFQKQIDTIEFYTIDDIQMTKPLGQRLLGTGNMLLITRDKTNPEVHLVRIPTNVTALYERMRPYIEDAKYRHRLMREPYR